MLLELEKCRPTRSRKSCQVSIQLQRDVLEQPVDVDTLKEEEGKSRSSKIKAAQQTRGLDKHSKKKLISAYGTIQMLLAHEIAQAMPLSPTRVRDMSARGMHETAEDRSPDVQLYTQCRAREVDKSLT